MAKPDVQTILEDARRLHDDRFGTFLEKLEKRKQERFNETSVDVPEAYRLTANQHQSNIIEDEGRQIATLVYAEPSLHLPPPTPQDQPATTKVEEFGIAMYQELEAKNGPVNRQCAMAQTHDNNAWIYFAPKKKPYANQPKAPKDDASLDEMMAYDDKNTSYKRDAGICAVFDYGFVATGTVLYEGSVYEPHCIYIWKEVRESELRKTYGVYRNRDGSFSKAEVGGGMPTGYPADKGNGENLVTVIEYWDSEWCVILASQVEGRWMRGKRESGYVLTDWQHNFGRVPYFARPAYVTEQVDEDKRFSGPLDGIHNEMPNHKRLRTMMDAVAYQTAFAPLQVLTKEMGETIVDDSGKALTFLQLVPGKAFQLGPGQEVRNVPQSPEVGILAQETAASEMRIQRFSLPPVMKGVSPGADTANATVSNLRAFNLSNLQPMADEAARQWQRIFRFALERIIEMDETVYVFNSKKNDYISLNGAEIPSVNIQVQVRPDQGQQELLIEKAALEMWLAHRITEAEFHEKRGKENPEAYVLANTAERLRMQLEPVIMQQIISDLGILDAVKAMIQANAQTGSARNAVPGLMGQAEQLNSGMGQGAQGQPRTPGVRMPTQDVNTQQAQANGVGGGY